MCKRLMIIAVVASFVLAAAASDLQQVCRTVAGKQQCVAAEPGTVLIRIKPDVDELATVSTLEMLLETSDFSYLGWTLDRSYIVKSSKLTAQQLVDRLAGDPDLMWAEPDGHREGGVQAAPNDPYFATAQWQLGNGYGADGSGLSDDCHSPAEYNTGSNVTPAWEVTTGSKSVAVMLNDSGWVSHPDLDGNKWSAPHAFTVMVNGSPLTCPAGTQGFNFYSYWPTVTCDPTDNATLSHGTETSGMVGAIGNNGVGVSGVAQKVTMVMMRAVGTAVPIDSQQIAAMDVLFQLNTLFPELNIRVSNNSWTWASFQVPSQAVHDEFALATANNVLLVFAAGNNGVNIDSQPIYPGAWQSSIPAMVVVGGYQCGGNNMYNFGSTTVHLGAPGFANYSTSNSCNPYGDAGSWRCGPGPTNYAYMGGTSSAAPMVAGAAALLWSRCGYLDYAGIKAAILNNVTVDPRYASQYATSGRLNVSAAMWACALVHPVRTQHIVGVGN